MSKTKLPAINIANVPNAKMLYLRLLRYAWRYKLIFAISILAMVVLSATNTGFLATIKQVTDEGFVKQDPTKVNLLPFMLLGLLFVRATAGFISNFVMRWVARH